MTNKEKILKYLLKENSEKAYCDDCLSEKLNIEPRQQVNQICNRLSDQGHIVREDRQCASCRRYKKANSSGPVTGKKPPEEKETRQGDVKLEGPRPSGMPWQKFQEFARQQMSKHCRVELRERKPRGFPKRFDMVSADGKIIGDAKYLTLVRGEQTPPAKFMEITGHVWLLEKTEAEKKFLVFGNQREVPEAWLKKYGKIPRSVEFYFLSNEGQIERLD